MENGVSFGGKQGHVKIQISLEPEIKPRTLWLESRDLTNCLHHSTVMYNIYFPDNTAKNSWRWSSCRFYNTQFEGNQKENRSVTLKIHVLRTNLVTKIISIYISMKQLIIGNLEWNINNCYWESLMGVTRQETYSNEGKNRAPGITCG